MKVACYDAADTKANGPGIFWPRSEAEMERSLDVMRETLLWVEKDQQLDGWTEFQPRNAAGMEIKSCTDAELKYNIELLLQNGYLRGYPLINAMPVITGLTMEGHDFLDNIRAESPWNSISTFVRATETKE